MSKRRPLRTAIVRKAPVVLLRVARCTSDVGGSYAPFRANQASSLLSGVGRTDIADQAELSRREGGIAHASEVVADQDARVVDVTGPESDDR
ncbi:hypothetical protein NPIL_117791 [Nephila pilipes]|uniref:Uncharacterized protein n=1 Tax=Nephila pilipes TaxID=299642 RepID=A0A8X6PFT6_NEPPI|nr:hypothetical protein NPIL_117791 [Nephila pilipes]